MFWNSYAEDNKGACEQCPEGTHFNPEGTGVSRCVCEEESLTLSYDSNEKIYKCTELNNSTACLAQTNTYWANNKCNTCPEGTVFKAGSSTRCVCEDSALQFNQSTGQCTEKSSSDCAASEQYWSTKENQCMSCPEGSSFDNGTCKCDGEGEQVFNSTLGMCMDKCPDEAEFKGTYCQCPEGMTLNEEEWKCQ